MRTVTIEAQVREPGSTQANALRRSGLVPCVMYHKGEENVHFSAPVGAFKELIFTPGLKRADILIDGKTRHALLKEAQFHPLQDSLEHADFIELVEGNPVRAEIPIRTTGRSVGEVSGGILYVNMPRLKVRAKPDQLLEFLEVDVSQLDLNDSLRVSDLMQSYPGLEFNHPETVSVVSVETSRAARAAAAEEAAAAAAAEAAALEAEAEAPTEEGAEAAPEEGAKEEAPTEEGAKEESADSENK